MSNWHFNRAFLKQKIAEGKLAIQRCEKNSDMYKDAQCMIKNFDTILKRKSMTEDKITRNDYYNYCDILSDTFNQTLDLISLDEWRQLKAMCEVLPKKHIENVDSHILPSKDDVVINKTLKLFKKIDYNTYGAVYKIVHNDINLINILKKNRIEDNWCFLCGYLKLPFVNVSSSNDYKYISLTHELRHAADYYLYGPTSTNVCELSSIYSEILMADEINKHFDCPNVYYNRINYVTSQMLRLISYVDALIRFERSGRRITSNNCNTILDIYDDKELTAKYIFLKNNGILSLYDYIVSTLMAVYFREEYYNGNKDMVNENIKQLLLGKDYNPNFGILGDRYVDYIKEVKTLSKK